MKIWGHYESVKLQGSLRTAEVYVPTFLNYGTLPFLVFMTPFAIIISSGDGFEAMKAPIVLLFTLATSSLSFLCILGTVKAKHNLKRILKLQELESCMLLAKCHMVFGADYIVIDLPSATIQLKMAALK